MSAADQPLRVLVCGTRFGEHYLAALRDGTGGFRLVGILARGSRRSRALAAHLGVPLYASPEAVPEGAADLACVVVRTTLFGGEGSRLAEALLGRGLHVLQEHPVHPTEIARLTAAARGRGLHYHVNAFYPHVPAGRTFIDYAGQARAARAPSFAELTTSPQLLWSSLDLLGRALGGLAGFRCASSAPPAPGELLFTPLQGTVGALPFSLLIQNFLDPADPDHHSLVMHRLALGWPEGVVNLVNSFGPVVWTHALYAPDYEADGTEASYLLARTRHANNRHFTLPSAHVLGPAQGGSVAEVVETTFPDAIRRALGEMRAGIADSAAAPFQRPDYLLDLGQAWLAVMRAAGPVRHRALSPPPPPYPDPRAYAAMLRDEAARA
ncbi:Gfo/Idh/MocA family oxidoreductase [Methylobacterium sp. R2-1]|uniref:Gfo/Idh/MocA family oxidoreductase n=1 Tax=Methylobacterium sp. R2-1 TaxID=2587064 RepID=UPI00161816CB|nr:Gfo/Idh/MocA family oxidoreductase [Methylobacterium sp. R2-1]MBB2964982.1 thiazolinyl imide reductase [Methylobacterium sp. R2-1]